MFFFLKEVTFKLQTISTQNGSLLWKKEENESFITGFREKRIKIITKKNVRRKLNKKKNLF